MLMRLSRAATAADSHQGGIDNDGLQTLQVLRVCLLMYAMMGSLYGHTNVRVNLQLLYPRGRISAMLSRKDTFDRCEPASKRHQAAECCRRARRAPRKCMWKMC